MVKEMLLFSLILVIVGASFTTITITRTLVVEKEEEGFITTRFIPNGRGGFIEGQLIPPVSAVILDESSNDIA